MSTRKLSQKTASALDTLTKAIKLSIAGQKKKAIQKHKQVNSPDTETVLDEIRLANAKKIASLFLIRSVRKRRSLNEFPEEILPKVAEELPPLYDRIVKAKVVQDTMKQLLEGLEIVFMQCADDEEEQIELVKAEKSEKGQGETKTEPISESMFLHSLDVSESEVSESDFSVDELIEKELQSLKVKKRMGQRQRRMLWEKKYGKSAKHLKQKTGMKPEKKVEKKKAIDDKPAHPSWTAKQQEKEKMQQIMSAGLQKKTIFGDIQVTLESVIKETPKSTNGKAHGNAHPSWIAKLKEKERMKKLVSESKNTKITFSDQE